MRLAPRARHDRSKIVRPVLLKLKSFRTAAVVIRGIELADKIKKG
jgi:hypothetical protein